MALQIGCRPSGSGGLPSISPRKSILGIGCRDHKEEAGKSVNELGVLGLGDDQRLPREPKHCEASFPAIESERKVSITKTF
jgi:hypothetical protein